MEPTPRPVWSPLTSFAVYLKSLRLVLDEALEARRLLVRKLGGLMEEARTTHRGAVIQAIGRVGGDEAAALRRVRARLDGLAPPPACVPCHGAVAHWLDEMVAACDAMADVGRSGNLARLRETQEHLAASRADARTFNAEYERLVAELRRRASALSKKQSLRKGGALRRLAKRVHRPAR